MSTSRVDVTLVIPVYRNREHLDELWDRVDAAFGHHGLTGETIFVDDASSDGSWEVIERLSRTRPHTSGVRLARNCGQGMAVAVGFERAEGRVLVTIDADLDSDPLDVIGLAGIVLAGEAPFVMGVRSGQRPTLRGLGSGLFNRRVRALGHPFTDVGSGNLAVEARIGRRLTEMGELRRTVSYKLALAGLAGRVVERPVRSQATTRSGYRWRDLAAIWLDIEVTFRRTPLVWPVLSGALAGVGAVAGLVAGAVLGSWAVAAWASLALVSALNLIALGVVGSYLVRTVRNSASPPAPVAAEVRRRWPHDPP